MYEYVLTMSVLRLRVRILDLLRVVNPVVKGFENGVLKIALE